jgi:glycosyltransferase involved in cell wall biosynthesis
LPTCTLTLGQYAWRLSVLASQVARVPNWPVQRSVAGSRLFHATEHLLPRLTLPTVLSVHDLIFERYPQHHKVTNRAFLRVGMPLFVSAASHIIAVSRHTAHDLATLYNVADNKITVIYEGVDAAFKPAPSATTQAIRARYSPGRPYFLMVGTLEPRKNHRLALEALAQMKAAGYRHRLLVAGGEGWLFAPISAAVEKLGLTGDVTFTGYVPGEELPALYTGATALLLPSQYEGFGLPLLEAMACGAPVICSRVSSLPELAGDAALMIEADDAIGLSAAMRQVVDQPELAATLRQRGFANVARFTWETCARQTADLYCAVANKT